MPTGDGFLKSGFDGGFIDQHDRNVVFDRIDPVTGLAFQAFRVLAVFQFLFACRTHQNLQQVFGNHDLGLYDIARPAGWLR